MCYKWENERIPSPAYYPGGAAPYIAKPALGSGSRGVVCLGTSREAGAFLRGCKENGKGAGEYVVQEYLAGRSYSIEVIGSPGHYKTYQVTEIHVDETYDCRRVTCPCAELTAAQKADFSATAIKLAGLVRLTGIMDVEAILHGGVMKVLEIDARLPSQTPSAVLRSTGVNLLSELYALFRGEWGFPSGAAEFGRELYTSYEHVEAQYKSPPQGFSLREAGEGLMSSCRPLGLYENRFGADEAITDYRGGNTLKATLISSAGTKALLEEKRKSYITFLTQPNSSCESPL